MAAHSDDASGEGPDGKLDGPRAGETDVEDLRDELERRERQLEATEEWAAFLERELEDRNDLLDAVIHQYEAQLEAAWSDDGTEESTGLLDRVAGLI